MRIWSLHPKYLDSKGLVALWRETLLAKNVLLGNTRGYVNHPQLVRFKQMENPEKAINYYLGVVYSESENRKYNFNSGKFDKVDTIEKIQVTDGQVQYEFEHLMKKLYIRDTDKYNSLLNTINIELHPLFCRIPGGIEDWEKY